MIKIGITGQAGFVGSHVFNWLSLDDRFSIVPFDRSYFGNSAQLQTFVSDCDAIIHLAAMNRHPDPEVIYQTNIALVDQLINACVTSGSSPHVVYSSSTQEERDNHYGRSKKVGKEKLSEWAEQHGGRLTSLQIPNVFGPFGKPNYNSVVATFCHKVVRGEETTIIQDSELGLIYINDLAKYFIDAVSGELDTTSLGKGAAEAIIEPPYRVRVSTILALLQDFKTDYMGGGKFPNLSNPFEKDLFNTFRCYIPADHYPVELKLNTDTRGSFVEIARTGSEGQFSYSTTVPDITRGNHFHTRKAERFAVIQGKALIQLRKIGTDEVIDYYLDGSKPAYVDMPIWYTHNIKNIGSDILTTLFWINEPYDPNDPDTYFEDV